MIEDPEPRSEGMTGVPVVILNWNGHRDTLECLRSIRDSESAGFVPVVVDNGSAPESLRILKEECASIFPAVHVLERNELRGKLSESRRRDLRQQTFGGALVLIENGVNLGFAAASNVGIDLAELVGAEAVLLLNNDTAVEPSFFRAMREFMRSNPTIAVATAQIRHYDAPSKVQNCGGELTYFGSRRYRLAGADAADVPRTSYGVVSFATGCALLLRHGIVGRLTEKYFFGEEDYELALRMRRRGLRMACVHTAVVRHKGGSTIRKSSERLGAIVLQYVCRLTNLRDYYSRPRWEITRALAYLYAPILLARSGIHPRRSLEFVRTVQSYIRDRAEVGADDFLEMIALR